MTDIETIAKGLTKAQRAIILGRRELDCNSKRNLVGKGLVIESANCAQTPSYYARSHDFSGLTHFGLAVRDHIMKEQSNG